MIIKKSSSQKAQIGISLTWVVAFVLIFFILAIFLFFSGSLSIQKNISVAVGNFYTSSNTAHQTFYTNVNSFLLLDEIVEFESTNLSLRQILEKYPKDYSRKDIFNFFQVFNKKSFEDTGFIYLGFRIDGVYISNYASLDCADAGWSNLIVNLQDKAVRLDVFGGICSDYNENLKGGSGSYQEYKSLADMIQ